MAETSTKKRFWKNAVVGLVSKVTQCQSIISKPDTRVNVLIPNLLGLRYGFTGPRYTELKDLKLSEIRVYKGHDSTKLKDALVNAIREAAKMRVTMGKDKKAVKETTEQTASRSSLSPPASPSKKSEQSPISFERDTTQENVDEFFSAQPLPSARFCFEKNTKSSQSLERHTTQANIAAFFSGNSAIQAKAHELEAAPTTPVTSHRNLMRNDTPMDPELQGAARSTPCVSGARGIALNQFKLPEITAAVSRAFRDAREDVLAKQSLEKAVAQSLLGISPKTFAEALVHLDEENKILLSDDLVFLV